MILRMPVGFRLRSHFTPLLVASAALVAIAPGCSSNAPATPQAGIVWTVEAGSNSGATCPVAGADTWTIGGGTLSGDSTVADQGTSSGTPVSVSCTVSGNDSSGYNVFATAMYGSLGSLTVQGHVDGTRNTQPNIEGQFNDNLPQGMIANLSEKDCTITYTNGNMGVAAGRIWAHIDCPTANDANRMRTCDANADFRFENCGQ
jgi:hypothetical protein